MLAYAFYNIRDGEDEVFLFCCLSASLDEDAWSPWVVCQREHSYYRPYKMTSRSRYAFLVRYYDKEEVF